MVVGLTGRNGAGKGEAAEFFKKRGFRYLSLSDEIRREIRRRRQKVTRGRLVEVGNDLRECYGHDVLARRVLAKLEPGRDYVVDSIRLPEEVAAFRQRGDFVMISVEAEPEIRFQRVLRRGRESDPSTLEEFLELERRESADVGTGRQQLAATEQQADHRVMNNATLADLHTRLELFLEEGQKTH